MAGVFERGPEVDVPHWLDLIECEEMEKLLTAHTSLKLENGKVEDVESLKAQVKKLNARAMEMKMALHDLSEELPTGLEKVMEVARAAQEAFQNLDAARRKLAAVTA